MPAVFVHGNPETSAVWRPLLGHLSRADVVCLSPPGFGAPTPAGWGATRTEYVDWLARELEAIDEPIDLVGHDWGGGHVLGLAMSRPELVRTWCSDIIGAVHPDYVWHEAAQGWQTPGVGEEMVAGMAAMPTSDLAAGFALLGMPDDVAADVAAAVDDEMGRCILALYRSAAQPTMANLFEHLVDAARRPGLAIIATEDHYVGTADMARAAAERAGAEVAVLEGLGHWWMCQDPARGAAVLEAFWSSVR